MASYTEHYQLHQWEPEDPFLRTDFNEDFQKIDTAIAERGDCLICNGKYVGTGTNYLKIRNPLGHSHLME